MSKKTRTIGGKMTKREALRQMWSRAVEGESSRRMAMSYVARRIGKTVPEARQFVRDLNRLHMIASYFDKRSVVFVG